MEIIEGTTSRELRERFLAQQFVPVATEILARAPHAAAVGFVVGQYWADEAEDAVHGEYVLFADDACAWPPAGGAPDYYEMFNALFPEDSSGLFGFVAQFPELETNGNAITAFASYCPEGCHQEMSIEESHVLLYVARRAPGGGVTVEERGRIIRPEWEDRFDVGYSDEDSDRGDGPLEHAGPRGDRVDRVGFWARIGRRFFGR